MTTTLSRKPRLLDGYMAGLAAMSNPDQGLRKLRSQMAKSNEERINVMRRLYLATRSTRNRSKSMSSSN